MEMKRSEASKASLANTRSFDHFYYEHTSTIYDELPYVRDSDFCNPAYLREHKSAVIHSYRLDTEPYQVKIPALK